mmetsp:Transcript_2183/g.6142  ORF Transcript_2183/g.6142 Transcript_2183/m.6142 type:complete len:242 (+) Transcript_2183:837-1562(+)
MSKVERNDQLFKHGRFQNAPRSAVRVPANALLEFGIRQDLVQLERKGRFLLALARKRFGPILLLRRRRLASGLATPRQTGRHERIGSATCDGTSGTTPRGIEKTRHAIGRGRVRSHAPSSHGIETCCGHGIVGRGRNLVGRLKRSKGIHHHGVSGRRRTSHGRGHEWVLLLLKDNVGRQPRGHELLRQLQLLNLLEIESHIATAHGGGRKERILVVHASHHTTTATPQLLLLLHHLCRVLW